MAPTETLAEQHFLTVEELCRELGVPCGAADRLGRQAARDVRERRAILVGTHALIQEGVDLSNLAVAVVDEQHRFGVEQRKALAEGGTPHVLHMTATPIPRTLALTVYGDLQVTEIAKPAGEPQADRDRLGRRRRRAPRRTERLRKHLDDGPAGVRRLPADRGVGDVAGARRRGRGRAAAARRARGLPRRPACTGGCKPAERRELMAPLQGRRARRARRDDRDRGRRRRPERDDHDRPGGRPLRARPAAPAARPRRPRRASSRTACSSRGRARGADRRRAGERLQALVDTTDGFELAERDLELRGEGQLLGTKQSGPLRAALHAPARRPRAARAGARRGGGARRRRLPLDDEVEAFFAGADVAA